ncbi:MAG: PIN domain nuclease [Verrucomicrobia bacterium]|nr:PIN domain nuclease [Verrucomicrobiota bacterium]
MRNWKPAISMRLIDSSAWVEFLRRRGDPNVKSLVARLLQADHAAYTCPIRFELLSGVKPDEEDDLEQAFALSRHVVFEPSDWRDAALLERQLRARGLTIPRNDLFVATVAIRTGLPVVCRDTHFDAARKCAGDKLQVEQV